MSRGLVGTGFLEGFLVRERGGGLEWMGMDGNGWEWMEMDGWVDDDGVTLGEFDM